MKKRAYALFGVLLILFAAAGRSVWRASGSAEYVAAARGQSVYRLDVAKTRGTIYDCELNPLVGGKTRLVAAVAPTIEAVGAVEKATGGVYRDRLAAALKDGKPIQLELTGKGVRADTVDDPCVNVFRVPQRYSEDQIAPHVIGYLDSLGSGVSGIELAMNDVLEEHTGEAAVYYQVDAMGHAVAGAERQVVDTLSFSRGGAALTLDTELQKLAEEAGSLLGKGAVVVTEAPDCQIRALASFPDYSPTDLGAAAESRDGALVNRAFCAYAPGSVFKLVPAAVEAETGGAGVYTCTGSVNAGGMLFHCYDGIPHGEVDLTGALEKSCNCYFINAARSLGGQSVLNMAYNLGLGASLEFGRGLFSQAGTLPEAESLGNARALANFGFGQGETTITPVQMCGLVNAIASGGVYSTPKLILGTVSSEMELTEAHPVTDKSLRVMSASTARLLQNAMEGAALEGTAKPGRPDSCTVGIKTGTAQTGRYEKGQELLHFWYCGYVRGEEGPRYCITVLCESTPDDKGAAARAFRKVAQGLGERIKAEAE